MSLVAALIVAAALNAPEGKTVGEKGHTPFQADPKIQQMAEAYAQDAVDLAKTRFGERLDWTDESIRQIERIVARLHDDLPKAKPTQEKIIQFSEIFGSYVGEVHRRNHGGTWGIMNLDGQKYPGMLVAKGWSFWPWAKVMKRIENGPEDNIWHYYQLLLQQEGLLKGPMTW